MSSKMNRVLVFGWDGVPPKLIQEAFEQDITPNLKELAGKGSYGTVSAVLPIVTPANWYSAFTGVYPWRHGIPNFVSVGRDYSLRYLDITMLKYEGIWDILGDAGYEGVYVNIPISTPAPSVKGAWVSDEEVYREPDEIHVHPNDILPVLKENGYMVGYPFLNNPPRVITKNIIEIEERKLKTFDKLLEITDWRIAIFVARSPDYLLHLFYGLDEYRGELYRCLEMLDKWLGRFINRFDELDVMVFSDHGHMKKDFLINMPALLEKLGYLRRREKKSGLKLRFLRRNRLVRRIWSSLPRSWRQRISRDILDKVIEIDSPAREMLYGIIWDEAKVFPNVNVGGLKINGEGVFEKGFISKEEIMNLAKEIVDRLSQVEDDKGRFFKDIYIELSEDPLQPDIYLEPRDDLWFKGSSSKEVLIPNKAVIEDPDKPLNIADDKVSYHVKEGFYVFSGPSFKEASDVGIEMVDVAPTILAVLGISIPSDMDGRVRFELLSKQESSLDMRASLKRRLRSRARSLRRRFKG